MSGPTVPFHKSLGGRMFLFGIVPMGILLAGVVLVAAFQMAAALRDTSEGTLRVLADRVAVEIERGNTRAVLAAQIMAEAQVQGLFGRREQTSAFARRVLAEYPELTGAYFGYEPNADGADADYVGSPAGERIGSAFDARGRFIPYWFRGKVDNRRLILEPLVDMETSLYYQGCKELFEEAGRPMPQVTEPYVYEGKMIVEQTFPIVIDDEFKGIAGVDRALSDIVSFLLQIQQVEGADLFLISRAGKFVASTLGEVPLGDDRTGELRTLTIEETPYRDLFGRFHDQRDVTRLENAADPILGERCYFAVAPVPTGDWLVVVRQTEADVLAPIRRLTVQVLGAVAAALVVVTLLSWWITHRTTKRIETTVVAADALAQGRLGIELAADGSDDEAGRLAESFNKLVSTYRGMTEVCRAIAIGNFSKRLEPRSERDDLVDAINEMAEARQRAEQRVKGLLDTAPVGILLVDGAGVIQSANEEADRLFGYDPGELEDRSVDMLVPESIRGHHGSLRDGYFAAPDRRIMAKDRELTGIRKDGSEIFVEVGLAPVDLPEGLMIAAAIHDISDRKEAEKALRRSEERFELTVRGSGDGLWDYEPATGRVWWAERFRELLGFRGEEEFPSVVEAWSDILHPDDREYTLAALTAHVEGDVPYDVEYRLKTKSGEYRWFRARGKSLRDETGRSYRAAGSITDITDQKQAQEELQKLSRAVESGPATVVITDREGRIEYVNPKFTETTGYAADEVIGGNPRILNSGQQPASFYQELWETIDAGREWSGEFCNKKKNGDLYWESASISPIRDASGAITHFVAVKEDITNRKRMEEEIRTVNFLSDIAMELTGCGYWHIDYSDPDYYHQSERAATMLGEPIKPDGRYHLQDEWYARLIEANPETAEQTGERYQGAIEGRYEHYESTYAYKRPIDGEIIWLHAFGKVVRDDEGAALFMYGAYQDVTQQVADAVALREAKETAEDATLAKSTFLANMSHEIRTPMNGIIGMTELALDTELNTEQRDYLNTVQTSAEALLALINDILDFSKIEAGKLELDPIPFELRDALADMLNTLAVRAHGKGVELVYDVPPELHDALIGDVYRLRQIIVNLVGNAIKFTETGEVVVSVKELRRDEHEIELQFAVRDTGVGIPADRLDAIFQPFEQADLSTTKQFGGTGLGLTISVQLAECMGGRIWAESEVGRGSIFHFTAVFGIGVARPSVDSVQSREAIEGLPVLVVDDNETNRRILERTTENWGMRPRTVASAAEALAAMDRSESAGSPFRLVLSDLHMPEIDGFGLFERLQAHARHENVPVILLTSGSRPGDLAKCREMGFAAHLIKPVKQSLLLDAIMGAVGERQVKQARTPDPSTASPSEAAEGRVLRILLAEDNPTNQKFAVRAIEKAGHSVVVANNGLEAVEAMKQVPYDIVLMDIHMPEMDGYEATAAIREREQQAGDAARTPIIAMTANAMKGDREKCIAAGMDGYVSKPVKRKTLFAEIDRVLNELT